MPTMTSSQGLREGNRYSGTTLGLLGAAIALLLLELLSHIGIAGYNRLATEPIRTRSALVEQHITGIRTLLEAEGRRESWHPTLGWAYRAGFAEGPDTINEDGLRASRAYSTTTPDETRIAAFGDSFVYCNEVANPDCWTFQIEETWDAEVLNYGVGGYGTDQAFLRYVSEGERMQPDIVLIGFAPVDLRRVVNRYRGFLSQNEGPWFKPRFTHEDGALRLIPTPVGDAADARRLVADPDLLAEIGDDDHWYNGAIYEHPLYQWSATYRLASRAWLQLNRRMLDDDRLFDDRGLFRPESEAFELQVAVMEAFADSVSADGARAIVLMLPGRSDVDRHVNGLTASYQPLADSLQRRSISVLDPIAELASQSSGETLFAPGGHYSPRGNSVIAGTVAEALRLRMR